MKRKRNGQRAKGGGRLEWQWNKPRFQTRYNAPQVKNRGSARRVRHVNCAVELARTPGVWRSWRTARARGISASTKHQTKKRKTEIMKTPKQYTKTVCAYYAANPNAALTWQEFKQMFGSPPSRGAAARLDTFITNQGGVYVAKVDPCTMALNARLIRVTN